ncbi:MAG TPA: AMP-binding protein [Desulfomonilia bacterium]|nr:AMP-binding protein [Desulfomonilia bacterium]
MSKTHLNQAIAAHFVEMKADEFPEKEIFIFERGAHGEDILTYKELYEKSNKFARLLVDHGVGEGDTYGVFMRNDPEFVYALLGGNTIGAIMIPIDPRSRGDRLKFFFKNSGAKAAVVSDECLEQFEEVSADLPDLKLTTVTYRKEHGIPVSGKYHALNETLGNQSWQRVDQKIFDTNHPMQIIYTSGTTGDPKGVKIRNNRTGMFTIATKLVWKYKPTDVLYNGLSLTHGNAQAVTLFPAMYMGIKAVFSSRFTKSRIWDICRKYGCTTFSLLGGMMGAIYNEPEKPDDADNPVQVVISAGTPASIWETFEKRFNVKILEWYGAVEGGFAFKPIGQGPIGSFGKPVPGIMEFKVVDENDNEVPVGQSGELISRMVRGDTKVDYLGLPDASKDKTRGGWLRSGDIVHRDKDGWYYFDYRKGSELRRSGCMKSPDHVEKVIGEHPDVSEVCVYGVPAASGAPGESDLVAAIAPFEGKTIDPKAIYEKCRKDLEPNFIPSFLQIVPEIPKTISEKALDRKLREEFEKGKGTICRFEDYK